MAETRTLITAAELEGMSFPDERVELSEGELIRMPPAGFEHGYVVMGFGAKLGAYVKKNTLGAVVGPDTGFRLDEHTVRSPDIGFVSRARLEKTGHPAGFFPGAPDLAVEVFSPSDSKSDLFKKIQEYFRAGTRLVWALFPAIKQVYVYRGPKRVKILGAGDTLDGEDLLPGFSIAVDKIFP